MTKWIVYPGVVVQRGDPGGASHASTGQIVVCSDQSFRPRLAPIVECVNVVLIQFCYDRRAAFDNRLPTVFDRSVPDKSTALSDDDLGLRCDPNIETINACTRDFEFVFGRFNDDVAVHHRRFEDRGAA